MGITVPENPVVHPCPTALELSLWKDGLLDSPRFEEVGAHVDSCQTCLESLHTLKRVRGTDALMDQLEIIEAGNEKEAIPEALLKSLDHLKAIPGDSDLPFEAILPFTGTEKGAGPWGGAGLYQILAPLACGGMSLIFLGRQGNLNRMVAVKFLKPDLLPINNARGRFLREARVMASLDHSHLVPILDAGEVGGLPYLVMPLLLGETLAERLIREKPLPVQSAIRIGYDVCKALDYLHSRGLVHRDVKPSNLWVHPDTDEVRLGDLGVVLEESPENNRITTPGTFLGTPGFQAPEIIQGKKATSASDLFSLGATLFECLAGRSPFSRTDWGGVIEELALKKLPRVSQYRPEVPVELDDLIARMLEKEPENRPKSAMDAATVLKDCLTFQGKGRRKRFANRREWLIGSGGMALGIAGACTFLNLRPSTPNSELLVHYGNLLGHDGRINSLVFSPDGTTLYSSGADAKVRIWGQMGKFASFNPNLEGMLTLAISPNGKNLVCLSAKNRIAKVFNLPNPEGKTKQLELSLAAPIAAAIHPSGEFMAVGVFLTTNSLTTSKLSTISLKSVSLRKQMFLGEGRFNTMVYQPTRDVHYLSYGKYLEAWSIKDLAGTRIWQMGTANEVKCLALSGDGKCLYAATGDNLLQYSTEGILLGKFKGKTTSPLAMALLDKGKTLGLLEEKALSLWSIATRELLVRKDLPAMDPGGPANFHPEGQCIAYSSNNAIRIESLRQTGTLQIANSGGWLAIQECHHHA